MNVSRLVLRAIEAARTRSRILAGCDPLDTPRRQLLRIGKLIELHKCVTPVLLRESYEQRVGGAVVSNQEKRDIGQAVAVEVVGHGYIARGIGFAPFLL